MKKEDTIHHVLQQAEGLFDSLQGGGAPSAEDCKAMLGDLEELRNYAVANERATESSVSIDELFLDFTTYAADAKLHLQGMLTLISEGKAPDRNRVDELNAAIEYLRQKYASLYRAALAQLPPEEMPGEDAAANEFVEAVKNSQTLRLKKRLEEAVACLKKFISVRSLVEAYAKALAPYQVQASEMLCSIRNGAEVQMDALEESTAGPITFLAALECEDKNSEESMELFDRVDDHYPKRVGRGLAAGAYFADDTVAPEDSASGAADAWKTAAELPETPDAPCLPAEKAGVPFEDAPGEDSGSTAAEIQTSESAFVKDLRNRGCFVASDAAYGCVSIESSQVENKKVSSTVFINEMKQGYLPAETCILRALEDRNCISQRLLTEGMGVPADIAAASLDYLFKRGFLRRYGITPGGEFYCASPRLIKALTYMDACKYVGVKRRTPQDWGEPIEAKASAVASRVALSELYVSCISRMQGRGVKNFTNKGGVMTAAFCCKVSDADDNADCELFLGAFWESGDECDTFMDSVREILQECNGASAVVIASLDLQHARDLTEAMLNALGEGEISAPIYLYALSENTHYAYPALEPVDALAVGNDGNNETPENGNAGGDASAEIRQETDTEKTAEKEAADGAVKKPAEQEIAEDSAKIPEEVAPAAVPAEAAVEGSEPTEAAAPVRCGVSVGKRNEAPSVSIDEIKANVYRIICGQRPYAALAYLKALSKTSEEASRLYMQFAYALNDPMAHCGYSSTNAFHLIAEQTAFENEMVISMALRMFFSNQVRYDYSIKSFYGAIKDYPLLNRYPSLSKALYTLVDFKDTQKKGMDAYADYRAKSRSALDKELSTLRKEASSFYDNFVAGHKKENCSQKRFLETKTLMFSVNSDFGQYIKAIVEGDDELEPLAAEFLRKYFYGEEVVIAEDTFDSSRLWNYIQTFWDKAGTRMTLYKRHDDLKSRLRSNITNQTVKAVQLLARWSNLVERRNDQSDDAGTIEYMKAKKGLLENLHDAHKRITSDLSNTPENSEERAGLTVLALALTDLLNCLNGSFEENSRRYYYAPFLLTQDVVLGEDFMPDFDVHSSALAVLQPEQRILAHVNCLNASPKDYLERLHEILDERGDDYGSARQIVEYLSAVGSETDWADIKAQIETGEFYAKETADIAKANFIGDLELAQSYGQIDNSVEDKKEMILQIVDEWYEWATDTANYGFFTRVMAEYLRDIKCSAKARESDLLAQLEKFKSETAAGLSVEEKERRIARIQTMIEAQNYTVAEDFLARSYVLEEENETWMEEDFLKEFLDNYDDYYAPVAKHNANFSTLVSSRTRNKEERGAKRLADSWLPGGSALGKDRLMNLLNGLGFKIASIQPQGGIGKFENFFVKTLSIENGKRVNYTHPIAALGSGAAQEGFRVVCINGAYSADGLIDIMKNIGDAKHTLILLDSALSKSERRRLARKTKNALGDKLFAVVDRTVMMFLVRNFDENKINRMVISLITPFGYYQPYVWDSANVMPPEIFMGRKNELERIKSATGVNIVYGGRQLGKSALLKKAKEEIDRDENNDRAIYIEIKDKNYEEAARKVGHELFDQHILEEDIDTTDWDVLARAVKRRLQSGSAPHIPYLLLLLDEADAFIESCEAVNYKPLDALKDIQSIGTGRFKFVIAGLRNVVRFKREAALGNNSVLTHLQSMTVTPFNTSEARELLELPLHYLGLRFPKEKESLITLILATTNYFPGLIQLYCAKLLEAMRSKDYAGYDEVDTPIYEVSEKHIKKVLADPSFTQQIREKFEITLKLGGDNYYYLIALLMAYLYHNNGYNSGYSAADIREVGSEFGISGIASLEETKLAAFMEEMKELNVLRSTDETHYLFTRVSFFQMMGTSAEVDDKLEAYMEV